MADGEGNGLPIDFHGCSRVGDAEGVVRALLAVEPEEGLEIGIHLDLGSVALQVGLVVFDGAPESLDEDVVQRPAPSMVAAS